MILLVLYHYCSTQTFGDILTSKVLWLSDLTNFAKINDKEEVIRTFEVLWNNIKPRLLRSDLEKQIVNSQIDMIENQFKIEILVDPPFGCCFCRYGDELQQWSEYGDKTKGVSLGFNFEWFKNIPNDLPHPNSICENSIGYSDVLYHNLEVENAIYEICYNSIKLYGLTAWIMGILSTFKHYSGFIKNYSFHGEYETRIVYYPSDNHDYFNNSLHLTGPIKSPYAHYCLPWTYGNNDIALSEIVLGCNCNISENEVRNLLIENGINRNVNIKKSSGSYRIQNN